MNGELNELHEELKDILEFVIKICEENNIEYYMAWGSCLGAVRHNGFIPWDDDIDMYIQYNDYERFKQICIKEQGDKYFYQDIYTDPNYFLNFSKVRKNGTTSMTEAEKSIDMHWGIGVDLFPLFEYDREEFRIIDKIRMKLIKKIAFLPYFKAMKNGGAQKILACYYKLTGAEHRDKKFARLFNKLNKKGDYYMELDGCNMSYMTYKKKVFGEGLRLPFDELTVNVPYDYDAYLKVAYGDTYMQIPEKGSADHYSHDGVIIDSKKGFENYR